MRNVVKKLFIVVLCVFAALCAAATAYGCGSSPSQGGTNTEQGSGSGESGGGTQGGGSQEGDKKDDEGGSGSSGDEGGGEKKDDEGGEKKEDDKPEKPELKEFENISFDDAVFTYDGQEKIISISGNVPEDSDIQYTGNAGTDAGEYNAAVTITKEGYKTFSATAKLTILKAEMSGVEFSGESFKYDGNPKKLTVTGAPTGSVITFYCNNEKIVSLTEKGKYTVTAVITNKNYFEKRLTAEIEIKGTIAEVAGVAKEIVEKLTALPDVWSFLPQSFDISKRAEGYTGEIDYATNFVSVSRIPVNGVGKQLNVMYNALAEFEYAYGALKTVHGAAGAITSVYQAFINDNPENYSSFESKSDGTLDMSIKITLQDKSYNLLASFATFAVELSYDDASGTSFGRVQINSNTAVKYEFAKDRVKIAVKAVNLFATVIEFNKTSGQTKGYIREFYGTESKNLKNSAVISVGNKYTSVISNKRETDDLIMKGSVEIYSNDTGNLLASEVQETVKAKDYDTYWFNLRDVSGINTIKAIHEVNGLNMDTIFINGGAESIHTKIISLTNPSRRFDIEMKESYFYRYDEESGKYEKVKESVPMLFVQRSFIDDFSQDFYSKNKNNGASVAPKITVSKSEISYLNSVFETLYNDFETVKNEISYSDIKEWIGDKDKFFN